MDNIAHSLLGATLAQTGLKRLTPLATATLVIGANLPDIDGIAMFWGSDTTLYVRRGWTHGVLALVILPWVLMGLMMLYDRYWRRRRDPTKDPVRPWATLGLAYLGVLTHPFLDWLNTYGVRLLMPFDGRWFYGDTLFILDPWLWLLMAAAVVFAHSRSWISVGLWVVLGVLASALVTLTGAIPVGAKIAWWVLVAFIVIRRMRGTDERQVAWYGRGCLIALCLYLGAMFWGNDVARSGVSGWLEAQGVEVEEIMTGPMPANPLRRSVVALGPQHYFFAEVELGLFGAASVTQTHDPLRRPVDDPVIRAAVEAESVRGLMNWIRYPSYEVERLENGYRVTIQDMRYARPGEAARLGQAVVELDDELRPRE